MVKIELTRKPFIKNALKSRYPQLAVFIVMLVGYIFAILAGLVGTPVGSYNFSIVFVWIAWWAILILVAVPFFGRGWCAVCPIPLPGEWLQRGAILSPPDKKPKWLNLRWPKFLRNIWLQNISFLLLALFSRNRISRLSRVLARILSIHRYTVAMLFRRRDAKNEIVPIGKASVFLSRTEALSTLSSTFVSVAGIVS